MISAQDLIEKITAAATCDDCIVVVKDKTQANLRWAGSTLTTNGVIQERSVTVVAFVAVDGGMASGGVTRTDVSLSDIPALLSEAIAAAKAAGPADDLHPLPQTLLSVIGLLNIFQLALKYSQNLHQHLAICFHDLLLTKSSSLATPSTPMKLHGLDQRVACAYVRIHQLAV